jgi:hypothetical protein
MGDHDGLESVIMIGWNAHTVPDGEALCWRVPPPSYKEYTLLNCAAPALRQFGRVKPGDPRCNKYEERQ